jgi:formylglycine-generating enzyme required for sulfatase activity
MTDGPRDAHVSDAAHDAPADAPIDAPAEPDAMTDGALGPMVPVPAGAFMMGCDTVVDTNCSPDEYPYHAVMVSAYEIDRREVTQADWQACMDASACTSPQANYDPTTTPDQPVRDISFAQAAAYCTFMGKRLPTEAEWEKAARDEDGRIYPWGNSDPTCALANFQGCGGLDNVGARPAGQSPHFILDMAGNVWEWVSDFYDSSYYASSPAMDPTGPASGSSKVARGGSFSTVASETRTSNRISADPTLAYDDIGLRCVR